jgi:hypothetical protein
MISHHLYNLLRYHQVLRLILTISFIFMKILFINFLLIIFFYLDEHGVVRNIVLLFISK